MAVDYAYPPQLAQFLRPVWDAAPDAPPLMEQEDLERVLTVAYQASLLRDEDRTIRLRIVVAPPEAFDAFDGPPHGLQSLVFDTPFAYTPGELRRLGIAAKYHRALIGVHAMSDGTYGIWGMLQSGPGWLHVSQGARGPAAAPPLSALVVRVLGPGHLAVGRGLFTLAELRAGIVGSPGMDVFGSKWLSARFAEMRAELAAAHATLCAEAASAGEPWAELHEEVIQLISQAMVRRFLAAMLSAHHGGAVILLDPKNADAIVASDGPLRVKYAFRDGEPRRRYRRLILSLMRGLARRAGALGMASVDADAYATLHDPDLDAQRDAIFEMSQLIAGLSEVDGAVVMTKRFELLGFGAEIVGDLGGGDHVARALDLEADDRLREPVVSDGTRHRSVYRLCAHVPNAVAIVVSQDGAVRFVAMHRGEVTFWEHAIETVEG